MMRNRIVCFGFLFWVGSLGWSAALHAQPIEVSVAVPDSVEACQFEMDGLPHTVIKTHELQEHIFMYLKADAADLSKLDFFVLTTSEDLKISDLDSRVNYKIVTLQFVPSVNESNVMIPDCMKSLRNWSIVTHDFKLPPGTIRIAVVQDAEEQLNQFLKKYSKLVQVVPLKVRRGAQWALPSDRVLESKEISQESSDKLFGELALDRRRLSQDRLDELDRQLAALDI